MRLSNIRCVVATLVLVLLLPNALALTVSENFTGTSVVNSWISTGSPVACLTASTATSVVGGQIPGCPTAGQVGGYAGSLPDPTGNGALRLSNSSNNQHGGIIYNQWFPAASGISVIWTSYTYLGDSGGQSKDGADGMGFFLIADPTGKGTGPVPSTLGATGGSLGYSCSNTNAASDGITNGYLGVGMDEFGNFANAGDNTASGPGLNPQAISMRGAGNLNLAWLNSTTYKQYYSSGSPSASDIQTICKAGKVQTGTTGSGNNKTPTYLTVLDYPFVSIPGLPSAANGVYVLPSTQPIANESATNRQQAIPVSYQLQITPNSLLSLWYSYNNGAYTQVIKNYDISNTAVSGVLPAYLTFGFSGSTGGSRNVHEITCFQAAPQTTSASSAGTNTQPSAQIQTGTQVYLAYYHPYDWWGQLASYPVLFNTTTNVASVSQVADWDASCVLTGGACTETGATSGTAEATTSRQLITWSDSGTKGIPFEYSTSVLSTNMLAWLNSTDNNAAKRLAYLRGDRTNEINSAGVGLFRERLGVLGDIIDSSPAVVGPPAQNYGATWGDTLYPSQTPSENVSGATTYPTFLSTYATRANIVWVGANDGILHGFRSGAYTSTGVYSTSTVPNDGQELLGYVPNSVIWNLNQYTSSTYPHQYFVNAQPATGDLFYNKAWHTWLVSGLGAGGQAIFALDVTDPSTFSESNASTLVKGEWSNGTAGTTTSLATKLSCVGNTACAADLGYTFGTPVITRFHNGSWGAVFGNGYSSSTGVAAIYIMLVDPGTGAITFYELSTGYGKSQDPTGKSTPNGIYFTTAVDLDSDNTTDYVYAGDLFGNIWRFDVTSANPASWKVSSYGSSAVPLFSTPTNTVASVKYLAPITTKLLVGAVSASATNPRVMVYFGTGQKVPFTSASPSTYATGNQAAYGVWDWNMTAWNALSTMDYAVPASGAPTTTLTASTTTLQTQTVQYTVASASTTASAYASLSSNAVCWTGTTTCSTGNTQYGWQFVFPNSTEQLIYSPQTLLGALTFNTTIAAPILPASCSTGLDNGWSYALDPSTGGSFTQSFFANDSNTFAKLNGYAIHAVQANAVGAFQALAYKNLNFIAYQTSQGQLIGNNAMQVNASAASHPYRLTWVQLR